MTRIQAKLFPFARLLVVTVLATIGVSHVSLAQECKLSIGLDSKAHYPYLVKLVCQDGPSRTLRNMESPAANESFRLTTQTLVAKFGLKIAGCAYKVEKDSEAEAYHYSCLFQE